MTNDSNMSYYLEEIRKEKDEERQKLLNRSSLLHKRIEFLASQLYALDSALDILDPLRARQLELAEA